MINRPIERPPMPSYDIYTPEIHSDPDRPSMYWVQNVHKWHVGKKVPPPTLYVRASAVGNCPKALAAQSIGYSEPPFSDDVLRAFQQGHDTEQLILDWFTEGEAAEGDYSYQYRISTAIETSQGEMVATGLADLVHNTVNSAGVVDYVNLVDGKTMSIKLWSQYGGDNLRDYLGHRYAFQMLTYSYGLIQEFDTIPNVHFAVGWIDRDTGRIVDYDKVRFSVAELETYLKDGVTYNTHVAEVVKFAKLAGEGGLEALGSGEAADFVCRPTKFGCRMAHYHHIIAPATEMVLDDVPGEVAVAIGALGKLRKGEADVKAAVKTEKDAKATIRKWVDGMGAAGLGKRNVAGWEIALTQGDAKETVDITAVALRELLGDAAEKHITTTPGRKTMRVEFKGSDWGFSDD